MASIGHNELTQLFPEQDSNNTDPDRIAANNESAGL